MYCIYRVYHMEYIEYILNHIVLQISIQYIKKKCRIFLGSENNEFHDRYERFLKIMMLSVLKNTLRPVKFWFIKNYLSPQFKVLSWACGMPVFFSPLDSSCQWYGYKDKYYPHILYPLEMYYTYIPCLIPNAPILKISGGGGCRVWFHTWPKNMVLNTIWWHTSGPHGCTSKVRSSASSGHIRFCSLMFFSLFLWKRCNGFPSH